MATMKITKAAVDKLPTLEKGNQIDYFDTELKGFGVRVSHTGKTYFVMKRVKGNKVRVTIGRHGEFTPEQARKAAANKMVEMQNGENPNVMKRQEKVKGITLQKALEAYLEKRKLKPSTQSLYKRLFKLHLFDWLTKPAAEITRDSVNKRHSEIANGKRGRKAFKKEIVSIEQDGHKMLKLNKETDNNKHREASADGTMRVLRAVLNFTFADDEEDGRSRVNPVITLSRKKAWFKVGRRRNLIKNSDLPRWCKAVTVLDNPHLRDYFLFLLYTGLRRNEAARLKWSQVDLQEKVFTIIDTKNKEPHTLPMSDYLYTLLKNRHDTSKQNEYVFPGSGKTGYIQEPKRAIEAVAENTGIIFSCHDLRRTFATIAESLDLSSYTVKALLNHKQRKDDVTGGYIVLNTQRLREPMQRVTDEINRLRSQKPVLP